MATSDAGANAALDREVTAGGSWWVSLATNDLDAKLVTAVVESPMPRIEVPRNTATWAPAAGRAVQPIADVNMGTAPSDFTPTFWVFFDAHTGGTPQHAARIPDVPVTSGSLVLIPAATLTLTYP